MIARVRRIAAARCSLPAALLLALAAAALGGCGGSGPTPSTGPSGTTTNGDRPPVILGTKSLPQYLVLGRLYKQALEAKGFTVELKQNVASVRAAAGALARGQIDAYPEPIGGFDEGLARDKRTFADLNAALAAGRAYATRHGLVLLDPTPFADGDALAVLPEYAQRHAVASIPDLARLGTLRLGARPEFRTHHAGLPGLRDVYGLADVTFFPLTTGVQYGLLDDGHLDVAGVSTTDGQLADDTYRVLADPQHLFGFQNVTVMVRQRTLDAEGPTFADTLAAVNRELTTTAIEQLVAAVTLDRKRPEDVARDFLAAHPPQ